MADIKKALPSGRVYGSFVASPIVDARPKLFITLLDTATSSYHQLQYIGRFKKNQ